MYDRGNPDVDAVSAAVHAPLLWVVADARRDVNWELLVAKGVIRIRVAGVGFGGGGGHRGVYECVTVPSRE